MINDNPTDISTWRSMPPDAAQYAGAIVLAIAALSLVAALSSGPAWLSNISGMAPLTAVCLLAIGAFLVARSASATALAAGIGVAGVGFLLVTFSLISGAAYDGEGRLTSRRVAGVSQPTAWALLIAGAGLIAYNIGRVRLMTPFAILVAALAAPAILRFFSGGTPAGSGGMPASTAAALLAVAFGLHLRCRSTRRARRREREAALRERERQLASITELLPMGVALLGTDGRVLLANRAFQGFARATLPAEGAPGQALWQGWDRAGRSLEAADLPSTRALSGERVWPGDELLYIGDEARGPFWTRVGAVPYLDAAGEVVGATVVIQDIDVAHRATTALHESETRFRLLADSAPVLIWMTDADGNVMVNKAYREFLGLDHGLDIRNPDWMQYVHPDDRAAYVAKCLAPATSEQAFEAEVRLRRHDGTYRWTRSVGAPRAGAPHARPSGFVGATIDIHDAKMAQNEVTAGEQRLSLALEAADMGIWSWDVETGRGQVSAQNQRLFGLPEEQSEADDAEYLARIHPDDLDTVMTTYQRTLETGEAYEAEFRIHRGDTAERWIHTRGRLVTDAQGRRRLIGVSRDISDRKHREQQLGLLMREVNHRAKNMLALVQAIARQTAARASTDFVELFNDRLQALSITHDLVVKGDWLGVDMHELVRSHLAHLDARIVERIEVQGPSLYLTSAAAQGIGLALHELATNACRFGALSAALGTVTVSWRLEAKGFLLEWREHGGPTVATPQRQGFGRLVLDTMAKMSVDGEATTEYAAEGLVWRLTCEASNIIDRSVSKPEAPANPSTT